MSEQPSYSQPGHLSFTPVKLIFKCFKLRLAKKKIQEFKKILKFLLILRMIFIVCLFLIKTVAHFSDLTVIVENAKFLGF